MNTWITYQCIFLVIHNHGFERKVEADFFYERFIMYKANFGPMAVIDQILHWPENMIKYCSHVSKYALRIIIIVSFSHVYKNSMLSITEFMCNWQHKQAYVKHGQTKLSESQRVHLQSNSFHETVKSYNGTYKVTYSFKKFTRLWNQILFPRIMITLKIKKYIRKYIITLKAWKHLSLNILKRILCVAI